MVRPRCFGRICSSLRQLRLSADMPVFPNPAITTFALSTYLDANGSEVCAFFIDHVSFDNYLFCMSRKGVHIPDIGFRAATGLAASDDGRL